MKAYVDSNIFIYSMFAHHTYGKACKTIIDDLQAGSLKGVVSTLVPVEVAGVAVEHDPSKAGLAVNTLYSLPLTFVEISQEVLLSASNLASQHGLSGCDAVHVSTCLESESQVMISNDDELKRVDEITLVKPLNYGKR